LKIIDVAHTGLEDETMIFSIQQGDLTGDCHVNNEDLYVIAYYWMGVCSAGNNWCNGADIEQNETVNFRDFIPLANNWQK
jgi:hypothetical protein